MFSKKKRIILIAVPTLLGFALIYFIYTVWGALPPRKPVNIPLGDYSYATDYVGQKIQWAMKSYHLPSVTAALIDDQDTIWQETPGMANLEENIQAEPDTVYKLWSLAKVFTAIETMRLVEDGLVDLDMPITVYLPNFSIQSRFANSELITIRSILTHRSGLPRNECHWINMSEDALARLAASLSDCYQAYPVGYRYKYSNIGFDLLGYLIEKMMGERFTDILRKHLLLPIGMENSAFLRAQIPSQLMFASGYEYYEGKFYPYEQKDITSFPSGNLYSTIGDMEQFVKFIFRGGKVNNQQLIGSDILEQMFTVQPSSVRDPQQVGLGWKTATVLGAERMVWHDGGPGEGIGSLVALLPERKLGVILFANGTAFEGSVSVPLALDILEVMLKTKYGVSVEGNHPQQVGTLDPSLGMKYAGKYAAFGKVLDIFMQGNQLVGGIQGLTFNLDPLSETTFQPKHWLANLGLADLLHVPIDLRQMKIEFFSGEKADSDLLIINMGGIFYEICPRYPDFDEIPRLWNDLTGEYDLKARLPSGIVGSDVLGKSSIQVEDGMLLMSGLVGPMLPISETKIVILSGPFAGETMVYETSTGSLIHQNIVFVRQ